MGLPGLCLIKIDMFASSSFWVNGFILLINISLNFISPLLSSPSVVVPLSSKENTAKVSLPSKSSFLPPSTPIHSLPILSSKNITANFDWRLSKASFWFLSLSFSFFPLPFVSEPWIIIFSHLTCSLLNEVTIDLAFPPLLLLSKFEAKVNTTFVSIKKHV